MSSPLLPREDERLVTGWGRTAPSRATIKTVATPHQVATLIADAGPRGVLARGLGRSYGDAAQDSGGVLVDLSLLNHIELDAVHGTATVGAGVSIDQALKTLVPAGFFVPVTPGTRMVSIGGAIAADIHGKNHHVDGSFGNHVSRMTLITADGSTSELTPSDDPSRDLFWATVGGMGLTGIITAATIDLIPIETSMISVDTERTRDLDDTMSQMLDRDDDYRYSVAWVDSVATGGSFGRGVITRGDHATADRLSPRQQLHPLSYDAKVVATAPRIFPNKLLNPLTIRAFNEAWYRKAPKQRAGELQRIGTFFHPLDGVQEWSRVYGPQGFVQYQFVVPDSAAHVVAIALKRLQAAGAPSFLTVLKRFGTANPAPLSFPQPGWTLAADVPAGVTELADALDELDELVASEGGRVYLAKDSRMNAETLRRMYPRLDEWLTVRHTIDPDKTFMSDLARRLSL